MTKAEDLETLRATVEYGADGAVVEQPTRDGVPTFWVPPHKLCAVLRRLKGEIARPFPMLYDLTAIDERMRDTRNDEPASDFTLVYHLLSFERNSDVRIKVGLAGEFPKAESITSIWPSANWYECEVYDLFGIAFEGHPHLRRILMPPTWRGHPLRKDHSARATEFPGFELSDAQEEVEQQAMRFRPEDWGQKRRSEDTDFVFLNIGPQHPGTHGLLRIVLQLDGEEIVDAVPDIGFHHRGAEKMGERQSWHTYIPYTDRIDYLAGVMNNMAYLLSVEQLAGIQVPDRARMIRIMLCEVFRIASHLVWYGTFAQDLGAMSPVFYMFTDRERVFDVVEAICGGRMHPNWFRIGGVAQDLPRGWDGLVRDLLRYLPKRLAEYDKMVMRNGILRARTRGVGQVNLDTAIEWGMTGPNLRACGLAWDFRRVRPYGGYDELEFEIPIADRGDCYGRAVVRVAEMRQSLRIIEQCLCEMPPGPIMADHPCATPPMKQRTMHDIETLITHFLGVSYGPVIPPGEAMVSIEATKGNNGYYLVSDGGTRSYRTRIRSPSFPHMQMLPILTRGLMVPDLLAILGSLDYVLADVDR